MSNHPIRVEMSWSLPTPDNRVEYDLWTVPADPVSRDFLHTFKMISIALDHHAYFTPHMYIYDGVRSNCRGADGGINNCYTLCTNNGRYCATDPDGDLDEGISGAEVVKESLRRLCIWKHYGVQNGVGVEWWDYVREFNLRCGDVADFFVNRDCVLQAMAIANVDRIFEF